MVLDKGAWGLQPLWDMELADSPEETDSPMGTGSQQDIQHPLWDLVPQAMDPDGQPLRPGEITLEEAVQVELDKEWPNIWEKACRATGKPNLSATLSKCTIIFGGERVSLHVKVLTRLLCTAEVLYCGCMALPFLDLAGLNCHSKPGVIVRLQGSILPIVCVSV